MDRKRGFTLIELLVVIAIIALLMAIILPALNLAKEKARKTVCMTHVRSMITGIHAYSQDYKDSIPANVSSQMNASLNFYAWQNFNRTESNGWINLGRLYDTKIIDDPAIFYCPSLQNHPILRQEVGWTYERGGGNEEKATDYEYGLMSQINLAPALALNSMKLSQLRQRALVCDTFIPVGGTPAWAHRGYGLNVGFGDAHVEFMIAGKQVVAKAAEQKADIGGNPLFQADLFTACMFEAMRGQDYRIRDFFSGVRWGQN